MWNKYLKYHLYHQNITASIKTGGAFSPYVGQSYISIRAKVNNNQVRAGGSPKSWAFVAGGQETVRRDHNVLSKDFFPLYFSWRFALDLS